jgi:hypothetical protein
MPSTESAIPRIVSFIAAATVIIAITERKSAENEPIILHISQELRVKIV